MKIFFALAALAFLTAFDGSMNGIKIGSSEATVKKLTLKQVTHTEGMYKYRTDNGNDFSVTLEDGKVVYMENDWLQKPEGAQSLLPGLTFGKTTLRDIRQRFGSKGFVYAENQNMVTKTHLLEFTCYETTSLNNEVLVVVTKIPFSTTVGENTDVSRLLTLDAIVIAKADYLEFLWGAQKAYSTGYKKIML
ncbi:hypothetical protein [Flavobacterium subsaxonicum]|uniref:Uncharacterized protein n=1 Tax=Flavobacterium subsaxonicum WB 4.1-42 = DSM 21790 TaxID=1121898 RepID=A0A0A2MMJ6_9FLAO|nr:hypothetical protein [Flavobacterium subsaxonicum]KGO93544.1 hypothetical protein Q766_06125 [Flavobacterium subsaxonicum WB 4.1-42 = DSM 21790]